MIRLNLFVSLKLDAPSLSSGLHAKTKALRILQCHAKNADKPRYESDAICKDKVKTIPAETWKKIQKIVSALPDAPKTTGGQPMPFKESKVDIPKTEISKTEIALLDETLERVRLKPLGLDELIRKQLGQGYAHNYVDAIYKRKTYSIPSEVWNKIKSVIASIPDAPQSAGGYGSHAKPDKRRAGYMPLTKEMSSELDAQFERVGRSYKSIINRCPDEFKKFHKSSNISKWRKGTAKSLMKVHGMHY